MNDSQIVPAQRRRLTEKGIACAAAVRKAIGPEQQLLIDAHSRFGVEDGLALARALEPLNLFWLEEVTPAESLTSLVQINREANMPTAGGEAIYGGTVSFATFAPVRSISSCPISSFAAGCWN